MAKLPTAADVRQIRPVAPVTPRVDQAAYAAPGAALARGGSELFAVGMQMEEEQAVTDAMRADAEFAQRIRLYRFGDPDSADPALQTGYEGLEGQAYLDARGKVHEDIQRTYEDVKGKLSSKAARKFERTAQSRISRTIEGYEVKAHKARIDARDVAASTVMESFGDEIVDNPLNSGKVIEALAEEAERQARRKYNDDKVVEEFVETKVGEAIKAATERLMVTSPTRAKAFFAEHQSKVDPDVSTALLAKLKVVGVADEARSAVDAVLASKKSWQARFQALKSIDDTAVYEKAFAGLMREYRLQKTFASGSRVGAKAAAVRALRDGMSLTDFITKNPKLGDEILGTQATYTWLQKMEKNLQNLGKYALQDDAEAKEDWDQIAEQGDEAIAKFPIRDMQSQFEEKTYEQIKEKVDGAIGRQEALAGRGAPQGTLDDIDEALLKYKSKFKAGGDAFLKARDRLHTRAHALAQGKQPTPTAKEISAWALSEATTLTEVGTVYDTSVDPEKARTLTDRERRELIVLPDNIRASQRADITRRVNNIIALAKRNRRYRIVDADAATDALTDMNDTLMGKLLAIDIMDVKKDAKRFLMLIGVERME